MEIIQKLEVLNSDVVFEVGKDGCTLITLGVGLKKPVVKFDNGSTKYINAQFIATEAKR
jgi:hypothetical protein